MVAFSGCPAAHFVKQGGEDARTGAAQWMTQGNCPTVDVGQISGGRPKLLDHCQGLHGKCFIELNQADIGQV